MKQTLALLLAALLTLSCCVGAAAEETENPAVTEATAEPGALLYGDADGDGRVTIGDATLAQQYIAELITREELDFEAADLDFDGEVTINDVTLIQRLLAEFITEIDAPEALSLDPAALHLGVGESVALQASCMEEGCAVSFVSDDPAVAAVDENGNVTALSAGNAVITAKADKMRRAQCTVTVGDAVTAIALSCTQRVVQVGEGFVLDAALHENEATCRLTYASSDPEVAKIGADGTVTALHSGMATLTVTAHNGVSASCALAVTDGAPNAFSVSETMVQLALGDTCSLTSCYNGDIPAYDAVYTSSHPETASVDERTGEIKANAVGYAVITATANNGMTAVSWVTVKEESAQVTFAQPEVTMLTGEVSQCCLRPVRFDGAPVRATYTSDNSEVCSVTPAGEMTALQEGTAVITGTADNGAQAQMTVRVIADEGNDVRTTVVPVGILCDATWQSAAQKIIPKGTAVTVYGASADRRWLKVRYGEICGWLYNKSFGKVKNYSSVTRDSLPVVADDLLFDMNLSVKNIFNYVYNKIKYRLTADADTETLCVAALRDMRGACYHHAALIEYLYNRCGHEAVRLTGDSRRSAGSKHAWCIVKTESGWRHVDATWFSTRTVEEQYFVTDSVQGKMFTWDYTKYPACT